MTLTVANRQHALHMDVVRLARSFRSEAAAIDTAFMLTQDDRAIQGGAHDPEAEQYRNWAEELFRLARDMEETLP